ncbi:MAG: glutaminyl-peptide cyclotransferase [Actinomycetota bacterium]
MVSSRSAASIAPAAAVAVGVGGVLALVLVLAVGLGWFDGSSSPADPEAAAPMTATDAATVDPGDLDDAVTPDEAVAPDDAVALDEAGSDASSRADPASTAPATPSTATPTIVPSPDGEPVAVRLEVVATHPHDPTAYTQGLEVVDGLLLESTGLRGASTLRLVEPTSGEVLRSVPLADELFGEGATVVGDEVWQLTWTSGVAFLRGLDDLLPRGQAAYEGEGWGLCAEADRLVMSNGSSTLTFRDPATFEAIGSVEVRERDEPVAKLNELECVDGLVWANVFQTTRLLGIEPDSGRVVATADLAELVPAGFEGDGTNVANGVAHDPATGHFWLTGKRWPVTYEVALVPDS